MALLENCLCCKLAITAGFLAVYLLITYLIAFAFELLWILESTVALPTAAILLCAGYFTLALFAALLIHGLATKHTLCLIAWMFAVTVLTFPEAGMVIYMSIQYWRIESLYGITELTCWFARIVANVVELVIIQSLYTTWKEEEIVQSRLRDLSLQAVTIPRESSLNSQYYQNNGYHVTVDDLNSLALKRAASTPQLWADGVPNNYPFEGYQFCSTQSEFNASIFMPKFGNEVSTDIAKKTQSLMDLRSLDEKIIYDEAATNKSCQQWVPLPMPRNPAQYTLSLGRKSHLKIPKFASLDDLNDINRDGHMIQNRTGFYAQPIENFGVPIYYGPLDGPDFLIYKKQVDKLSSKNSLSNTSTDDVQKYRDIAL